MAGLASVLFRMSVTVASSVEDIRKFVFRIFCGSAASRHKSFPVCQSRKSAKVVHVPFSKFPE